MTEPASLEQIGQIIDRVVTATDRLLATASGFTDAQVREPSLLPGWTRGHVLSHIARNADGLRNLLFWAKTGIELAQYPSREVRDAEIEAGADRPAAQLSTDLSRSAAAFDAQARELTEAAWRAEVSGLRGPAHPAWVTLHRRLGEVEIHHVDLAAGYRPADWPDPFVAELLDQVTARLAADEAAPAALLIDSGTGRQYALRADVTPERAITGSSHELAAWLIGRSDGSPLASDPPGPLPDVPPF